MLSLVELRGEGIEEVIELLVEEEELIDDRLPGALAPFEGVTEVEECAGDSDPGLDEEILIIRLS